MSAPYRELPGGWPGVDDVELIPATPMAAQIAAVLDDHALHARYIAAATAEDWPMVEACEAEIERRFPPQPVPAERLRRVEALGAAARWYAGRGIPVFPLQENSKVPRKGSAGFKDATTDAETVRAWWRANPASNIGMPTGAVSGYDVIDVDGPEAWPAIPLDLATLGRARTARPGGWHLFIAASGTGNRAHVGGVPMDVRGEGGYVVLAPSRIGDSYYHWIDPLENP